MKCLHSNSWWCLFAIICLLAGSFKGQTASADHQYKAAIYASTGLQAAPANSKKQTSAG